VYLINYPILQSAQQVFLSAERFRTGVGLIGEKNGANHTFLIPGGEKFVHNLPFLTISVYVNGLRMAILDDFVILESGGTGTGFDLVIFSQVLYQDDHLTSDYVIT
jgi:hypothetical protein